jgi:hypothetical protein
MKRSHLIHFAELHYLSPTNVRLCQSQRVTTFAAFVFVWLEVSFGSCWVAPVVYVACVVSEADKVAVHQLSSRVSKHGTSS